MMEMWPSNMIGPRERGYERVRAVVEMLSHLKSIRNKCTLILCRYLTFVSSHCPCLACCQNKPVVQWVHLHCWRVAEQYCWQLVAGWLPQLDLAHGQLSFGKLSWICRWLVHLFCRQTQWLMRDRLEGAWRCVIAVELKNCRFPHQSWRLYNKKK